MEKMIMEKNMLICSNHLITQEKSIMENPGPLRELWKNKNYIRQMLNLYEETLIMEKNGDRYHLSKLDLSSIILSVTIFELI